MPSANTETDTSQKKLANTGYKEIFTGPGGFDREIEEVGNHIYPPASHPNYLPTWDPKQKFPPLQPFRHVEHGLDADKNFPDLLPSDVQKEDLTPTIGSVVRGIQLSRLNNAGRDQLALLTAQRRVLVFPDQDFASLPISDATAFAAYYGRLHVMSISGAPEGFPEIHIVHRGAGDMKVQGLLAGRTTSVTWHSDVTYEEQPPGTTIMYMLDGPQVGGDTLFSDNAEAYRRLSYPMQKRLHGLTAMHSGVEQVESSRLMGGIVRREPVISEHPIVRTHPVTGEKALFVNPQYTRYIVGLKKEESDMLLK
ncbi:putative Alpha-ketoglutarate-dependent sulfonate dioxygenase [Glarea lozoyensis 74030]|nr:putative Alpha-ketoglutarate-dependent sulfonate dioxygenase [Glarea lozoyensis 74030]